MTSAGVECWPTLAYYLSDVFFTLRSDGLACLAYDQYNRSLVLALLLKPGLGLRQSDLLYVCYLCLPAYLVHLPVFQPFSFAVFVLQYYLLVFSSSLCCSVHVNDLYACCVALSHLQPLLLICLLLSSVKVVVVGGGPLWHCSLCCSVHDHDLYACWVALFH